MAQDYWPIFNPDDIVQDTMGDVYDNFAALRSKFSGDDAPSGPEQFQWWAETDTNLLKMYIGSTWYPVYDFATKQIILKDSQVTSSIISDAARKGSIVTDEAIDPASCTLKTSVLPQAVPFLVSGVRSFHPSSPGSFITFDVTQIYCATDGNLNMLAHLRNEFGWTQAQFTINGVASSPTNQVSTGSHSWTSTPATLDTTPFSGWNELKVQVKVSTTSSSEEINGYTFAWYE